MKFEYEHLPHYLSLGAGVQSSTLALMYATGELTPMPAAAIFADTQAEPQSVYDYLDWLESVVPFPVHRVTKGSLTEASLKQKVTKDGRKYSQVNIPFWTKNVDGTLGKIPHRSCTADYKIKPIHKKLRELVPVKRGEKKRRLRFDHRNKPRRNAANETEPGRLERSPVAANRETTTAATVRRMDGFKGLPKASA